MNIMLADDHDMGQLPQVVADAIGRVKIPHWAIHTEGWYRESAKEVWLQLRRNFEHFEVTQLVACDMDGRVDWGTPIIQFRHPEAEMTTRDMGKIRLETTAVNNTVLRARQVTDPTLRPRKRFVKGGGRK